MELFFCPEESQVRRLCAAFGIPLADSAAAGGAGIAEGKVSVVSKANVLILCARSEKWETKEAGEEGKDDRRTVLLCSPSPASCSQHGRLLRQCLQLVHKAVSGASVTASTDSLTAFTAPLRKDRSTSAAGAASAAGASSDAGASGSLASVGTGGSTNVACSSSQSRVFSSSRRPRSSRF